MIAPLPIAPIDWRMITYGSGNFGKAALWTCFEMVLLFYLVSLCAMPAQLAGGVLGGTMLWDACADLLIAYAGDRRLWSDDRRAWLLLAAPLGGLGFASVFLLGWATGGTSWTAIIVTMAATRIAYTLCDVAHNSLLTAFAGTSRGASMVAAWRFLCSSAGGAMVGLMLSDALHQPTANGQRAMLAIDAGLAGLAYAATLIAASLATPAAPARTQRQAAPAFRRALAILWRMGAFRHILGIMAVQSLLTPLFIKALPFFGQAARGSAQWAGGALVELTMAQALTMPLLMLLAHGGVGNRAVLTGGHVLLMIGLGCLALAGDSRLDHLALALAGMGYGAMNTGIWALLGQQCRAPAMARHGLIATPYGLFLAVLKAAAGGGTLMISAALLLPVAWCSLKPIVLLALLGPFLGSLISLWHISMQGRPDQER